MSAPTNPEQSDKKNQEKGSEIGFRRLSGPYAILSNRACGKALSSFLRFLPRDAASERDRSTY